MDRVGDDKVKLLDMLTYLSFETGCIEEDIPMYMCDDCEVNLTAAYNLKLLCQKNNIYVRRYIFYLKQFTHPTTFANETEENIPVDKEKHPENKKKSRTDDIITIQLDLTNISDESDEETTQNEPNSVPTKVSNNSQPIVDQQCETSNSSILSKRPEFNSTKSKLVKIKNTVQVCLRKSSVSDGKNKVALNNETLPTLRQTRCHLSTRILSNRPEFNVYKNLVNCQSDQIKTEPNVISNASEQSETNVKNINAQTVTCQSDQIKTELNLISNASEQSATSVNSKANNCTNSTNINLTSLKRKLEEKLVTTDMKKAMQQMKALDEEQLKFNEFDIISTVKLRKRKSVKSPPTNIKPVKKVKKTYNIKKDKKTIQRMNRCKVVLHRLKVINEPSSIENKEIQSENNDTNLTINQNDNLVDNKNDNESVQIKEETNDDLENTEQNNTALQNNLLVNSTTQEEQNMIHFENVQIKQEICDEDITNIKEEDKLEDAEFSFKIEIVDDTSNNSVKIETIGEDTVHSITRVENINNSVFSFTNAAFLTPFDKSLNTSKDLTASTTQEYCPVTVGSAEVTKSTHNAAKLVSNAAFLTNCDKSLNTSKDLTASTTQEYCTATVGSAEVTKSTDNAAKLVSNDSLNTVCDDSTDSNELIIDEDAMSNDATLVSIASPKTVTKAVPSKVLSPRNVTKNVYKRFLDFTRNETAAKDVKDETGRAGMLSLARLLKMDDSDSEQSIVAKAVSEFERELSTVQLPNYKFPVSKRLLNFTSKEQPVDIVAPISTQLQQQDTFAVKLPMNGSPASCKTTTGSSALIGTKAEKPATTLVGTPVTEETTVGRIEESELRMSPFQLMIQRMRQQCNIKDNTASVLLSTEANTSMVGSTDAGDTTLNSESSNQDNLTANSDDKHKCPECNKTFRSAWKLKRHALSHKNFYHCPICTENYPTKTKFKAHMLIHKEPKYKCFMCDKIVPTNDALVQHYKAEHKNTRFCRKCKLVFRNRSAHIAHKKTHQPKRTCPFCNEQFTGSAFEGHKQSHTVRKCLMCEKYYDTEQFSAHNCRELTKTYKCAQCGVSFYFKPSFDKHMRMHYATRCFICGETFYNIVEHMSEHYGQNGYQCPTCDYCTFSKDDMKLHLDLDLECKLALQANKK